MDRDQKREFKDRLFEQFERVAQALASARRLEILDLLAQGEWSVETLAREAGMSVSNTSRHLQILREANLVGGRRQGVSIFYRLADDHVFRACQALRDLAQARLAEIERLVGTFLHDRADLEPVSVAELRQRLKVGGVVVLDVRSAQEYRAGHVAGARSLPVAELETRLREVPQGQEVIAYCRGPYCVFADEAVALLSARGYRARRLDLGFPEWQALGLPVERTEAR